MNIHLLRPKSKPLDVSAVIPAPPGDQALKLTQRAFLKTLAAIGVVGAGHALIPTKGAEASYASPGGTSPDTINTNLLIQGNVVVGPTYGTPTAVVTVNQSMNAINPSGILHVPTLTYSGGAQAVVYGAYSKPTYTINEAITSLSHFHIDTYGLTGLGTGGSLTNQFGLYITTPNAVATNNWAVYVAGGTSYFAGNVGIGVLNPAALLSVGAGSLFRVTSAGVISQAAGLTTSGSVTFSGFASPGGPLITNGAGLLAQVAAGTTTQVLHGGTTPSFASLNLVTDVTGVLAIANGGTGTALGSGTAGQALVAAGSGTVTWYNPSAGSVIFAGTGGVLTSSSTQFFWDGTNNRLGIGTSAPATALHLGGGAIQIVSTQIADSGGCFFAP